MKVNESYLLDIHFFRHTLFKRREVYVGEIGDFLQFEKSEHKAVHETRLRIAFECDRQIVVLNVILKWHEVVDSQTLHRPRGHEPLNGTCLTLENGFTQQQLVDVARQQLAIRLRQDVRLIDQLTDTDVPQHSEDTQSYRYRIAC